MIIDASRGALNIKPSIWAIDPGIVVYNTQRIGIPIPNDSWTIWEGSGDTIYSIGKYGNKGINNGTIWTSDGLVFDGTAWTDLPDNIYNSHNTGAIAVYIYPTSSVQGTLVSSASAIEANNFFRLYLYLSGGLLYPAVQNRFDNNAYRTTNAIPINRLGRILFTTTGSAWKIFLNGKEETLISIEGSNTGGWFSDVVSGEMRYSIGVLERSSGSIQFFIGTILSVTVWDNLTALPFHAATLFGDPYWLVRQPDYLSQFVGAAKIGAIMNQFQGANLGADLFNGALL